MVSSVLAYFINRLPRPPDKQSFRTDGANVLKKVKTRQKIKRKQNCQTTTYLHHMVVFYAQN